MKKLILSAGLVMLSFTIFAQEDFKAELRNFVELQSSGSMDGALTQVISMIPEANREAFKKEVNEEMKGMYSQVVDLYVEKVGKEDLQKMLEFYNTPAGKRILEKTPELTQESMELGQQWGMSKLQPIMQKYMSN